MTEPDEQLEDLADVFNSLSSYNRLYAYLHIGDKQPKHIGYDLDVTRNALQHYIDDWKELDLIDIEGKKYHYTERGKEIRTKLTVFLTEHGNTEKDFFEKSDSPSEEELMDRINKMRDGPEVEFEILGGEEDAKARIHDVTREDEEVEFIGAFRRRTPGYENQPEQQEGT